MDCLCLLLVFLPFPRFLALKGWIPSFKKTGTRENLLQGGCYHTWPRPPTFKARASIPPSYSMQFWVVQEQNVVTQLLFQDFETEMRKLVSQKREPTVTASATQGNPVSKNQKGEGGRGGRGGRGDPRRKKYKDFKGR